MQISANLQKDGATLSASCEFDMPETLTAMADKFGEARVYAFAKRAITVSVQNAMRAELDSSGDAEKAGEAGAAWTPPEPRAADPVVKAVKALKDLGLSEEQMAAVEASIRQQAAAAKAAAA